MSNVQTVDSAVLADLLGNREFASFEDVLTFVDEAVEAGVALRKPYKDARDMLNDRRGRYRVFMLGREHDPLVFEPVEDALVDQLRELRRTVAELRDAHYGIERPERSEDAGRKPKSEKSKQRHGRGSKNRKAEQSSGNRVDLDARIAGAKTRSEEDRKATSSARQAENEAAQKALDDRRAGLESRKDFDLIKRLNGALGEGVAIALTFILRKGASPIHALVAFYFDDNGRSVDDNGRGLLDAVGMTLRDQRELELFFGDLLTGESVELYSKANPLPEELRKAIEGVYDYEMRIRRNEARRAEREAEKVEAIVESAPADEKTSEPEVQVAETPKVKASKVAKELAEENVIDITTIEATSDSGIVSKADVLGAIAAREEAQAFRNELASEAAADSQAVEVEEEAPVAEAEIEDEVDEKDEELAPPLARDQDPVLLAMAEQLGSVGKVTIGKQ